MCGWMTRCVLGKSPDLLEHLRFMSWLDLILKLPENSAVRPGSVLPLFSSPVGLSFSHGFPAMCASSATSFCIYF